MRVKLYLENQHIFFEDKLKIKTTLLNPPSYSIEFQYEIFKDQILINEGYTKLIFFNKINNKPIRCPKDIADAINNFLKKYSVSSPTLVFLQYFLILVSERGYHQQFLYPL